MMRYILGGIASLLILLAFRPPAETGMKLSEAAIERSTHSVTYNGAYRSIPYPNGDVPDNLGVCTDVVVRSYRNAYQVDLQRLIHEDMKAHFDVYPSKRIWGLKGPDKNIDHRRVPNIECFLTRKNAKLPVTKDPNDYLPGDVVCWGYEGKHSWHIGIVTHKKSKEGVPLVVHNISVGPELEDFLFTARISGHYRWHPGQN